jgi:hypothetical protein
MNRRSETLALIGMAIGVATMLQPWWSGGMRAGFFLTLACTVGQIVVSHLPKERP